MMTRQRSTWEATRLAASIALFFLLSTPWPLFAEEKVPAVTLKELGAIDDGLRAMGLVQGDLGFLKDRSPSRWKQRLVLEFLANPLSAPAFASDYSQGLLTLPDRPGLIAAAVGRPLGFALSPIPSTEKRSEKMPTDGHGWGVVLSGLAPKPGYPKELLDEIHSLPTGAKAAILVVAYHLSLAAAVVENAMEDLDADERGFMAAYGPMLAIPADQNLSTYRPTASAERIAELCKKFPGAPLGVVLDMAGKLRLPSMVTAARWLGRMAESLDMAPSDVDADFHFRLHTRYGVLEISGKGDHVHRGAEFVVDFGGHDFYTGSPQAGCSGLPGRPLSFIIDGSGDDTYRSPHPFAQGGALLGAALLWDMGGDDIYEGHEAAQGAGLMGCGLFLDSGGCDTHGARDFSQGAACFGMGVHWADQPAPQRGEGQGNDCYRAGGFSQGFSRTMGFGLLFNRHGEDVYVSGDREAYRPLYNDRSHSLSQGFSIGVREYKAAGSLALLVDASGNDRYLGGVHGQGAACWFGAGFLVDLKGSDHYAMAFNAQGAAVHSAVGVLLDRGGDDVYVLADGLGQGAAHDYAVGLLLDHGGNDKYMARAAAQGVGLTNGFGLLIDRRGHDLYAGHGGHLQGSGRARSGTPAVGLLIDMTGNDTYREPRRDNAFWTAGRRGAGLDLGSPIAPKEGECREQPLPDVVLPKDYAFTKEKFDSLFKEAASWNVGEARGKVAQSRGELVAWGPKALPHLRLRMNSWGGLMIWALDAIVEGISKTHRPAVVELVVEAVNGGNANALAHGLRLAARLEVAEAGPRALALMKADKRYWLYTFPVAGALRLREAVPVLFKAVKSKDDSVAIGALTVLGRIADPASIPGMTACFRQRPFAVRFAAARALARMGSQAVEPLLAEALALDSGDARRVCALYALSLLPAAHKADPGFADRLTACLKDPSWSVRGWAAMVFPTLPDSLDPVRRLRAAMADEKHPFAAGQRDAALALLALPPGQRKIPRTRSGIVDYPEYLGETGD
jgi:hypothetical protein